MIYEPRHQTMQDGSMQDGCATQDVAHPAAVTLASPQRPTATTRHRVTAAGEPPASRRRAASTVVSELSSPGCSRREATTVVGRPLVRVDGSAARACHRDCRPWLSHSKGSNVYSQCWLLSCDQYRTVSLSLIRKPQARPNHGGTQAVAALTA
jgi:hypothetical protein